MFVLIIFLFICLIHTTIYIIVLYIQNYYIYNRIYYYIIQKIDNECSIVPRGALSLDTGKKVITNGFYQGLNYETSLELRAYLHLRRPQNLQCIALLKRPGIIKTDDFLDCIDKDEPKGIYLKYYYIQLMLLYIISIYQIQLSYRLYKYYI